MPGHVKDALQKFQHSTLTTPQHSPHHWTAPSYGSTAPQLEHPKDESPALNPDESRNVQQLVVTFLYCVRAFYPKVLVILNTIAAEQSKSTQETAKTMLRIINYAVIHYEEITQYHSSGMTLHMYINKLFLSSPGAKSIPGGYHWLSAPSTN